jgi:hypothetical protein
MTSTFVNDLRCVGSVIAILISFASIICSAASDSGKRNGVDFEIMVDKLIYSPGSTATIKFILTNTAVYSCISQESSFAELVG